MKGWQWLTLGLLATAALVAELVIPHALSHEVPFWERIPYFFGMFGFLGCAVIILLSKWIGKVLLQREENYYDEL